MAVTMNGYTRIDAIDSRLVLAGVAGHTTRLLGGPVERVLTEVGRRFHAEVEPVSAFNGWRSAALNAASGGITTSNHLSGTAVDINGYRHPRYQHGTFTAEQVATIRRILADLGGVVRWGGDWNGDGRSTESDVDEMHFEVVAPLGQVTTVSNAISGVGSVPGVPDLSDPAPIEEDDMDQEQASQLKFVYEALKVPDQAFGYPAATSNKLDEVAGFVGSVADEIRAARVQIQELAAQNAALLAAVQAVPVGKGVDPAVITAAAKEGARAALVGLTLKAVS